MECPYCKIEMKHARNVKESLLIVLIMKIIYKTYINLEETWDTKKIKLKDEMRC